jgi:hypothetical protein
MTKLNRPFERAMALAALSGLKIALGPAFLTTSRKQPSSRNWVLAAMAEMLVDKLGVLTSRSRLPLLIPHTVAGAWVAHQSMKEDGVYDSRTIPMGALVAASVAICAPTVRVGVNKFLGVPDAVLGVAEDYLALHVGSEATDISMPQIGAIARESLSGIGERVTPMLESVTAHR